MAKFSANAFKKELEQKARKSASSTETTTAIAQKAKDVMYHVIKKKVYNSYSPVMYERRGENGGLLDKDNIVTTISGNRITIENIASPNDSLIGTPLRENPRGLLYEWIDNGWIDTSLFFYSYNPNQWVESRMGLTVDLANNKGLKEFAAKTIVKNLK